jgi:hypothetical protein
MNMKGKHKARLQVKRDKDRITASFHIAMEGDLISVQTPIDYSQPEETKKLEQSIQKQLHEQSMKLLDKTLHRWQADCFQINNHVMSTFSDLNDWKDFNWKYRVKDIEYKVDVSFKMRRYGNQVGPAIEGDEMK